MDRSCQGSLEEAGVVICGSRGLPLRARVRVRGPCPGNDRVTADAASEEHAILTAPSPGDSPSRTREAAASRRARTSEQCPPGHNDAAIGACAPARWYHRAAVRSCSRLAFW